MKSNDTEKTFPKGTKVRLNIGGPDMVVKSLDSVSGDYVTCQWFVGKKLEEGRFAPESLILIKESPEAPKA